MKKINYLKNQSGFTGLELILVLAIIAIVAAIAIPQQKEMFDSFNRFNARAHLLEDIKIAQAYSVSQGCRGVFTVDSDGRGYSFGCDYLGYDTNDPATPDDVYFTREVPGDVTVTADNQIIFNSRGQTVDSDFIISNVTLDLKSQIDGTQTTFATGILLGTGIFKYQ